MAGINDPHDVHMVEVSTVPRDVAVRCVATLIRNQATDLVPMLFRPPRATRTCQVCGREWTPRFGKTGGDGPCTRRPCVAAWRERRDE